MYEGVQPVIGKRVAVKVLLPQLSSDTELVERFLSEARAVNAIRHRGIVDIFSFGQTERGSHYFVMEYLDGKGFDRLIKDDAPLAPHDVLSWTEEVLDALDAAHASGIIHRDIKPSNLFLVNPGRGRSYVKLLDFGIAKLGALKGEATPQTRASVIIGTPDYMSPEQARGRAISPATDLYALGCVMFELLTGRRVFKGENPMQTMFMHVENSPPRASEVVPDLPPELDDLLLWTLEKDPAQRPGTAGEMRSHVEALKKLVPNNQTMAFVPPPRSYSGPGGPATPGPGSTRSRRVASMGTPAPRSRRVQAVETDPEAVAQPQIDSTKIVPALTRAEPKHTPKNDGDAPTPVPARSTTAEVAPPAAAEAEEPLPQVQTGPPKVLLFAGLALLGAIGAVLFLLFRPAPEPLVVVPPPPPQVNRGETDKAEADKAAADKAAADKAAADKAAADKAAADKAAADKATSDADKKAADAEKKAAADKAAADKKAAADQAAADKKAADAEKKAAADKAAADKKAADAEKKAAADKAAAEKKAADAEKKAADADKQPKVASAKKAGKVYTAADLDARLASLQKKLEAKEAKAGGKDRVLRQFLDQGRVDAAKAQSDEDRKEVWKFLNDFEKQLGP